MRKVTDKAVSVFLSKDTSEVSISNTVVSVYEIGNGKIEKCMMLHGNAIAYHTFKVYKNGNTTKGKIQLSNRGYTTNTTKERLNGIIATAKGYSQCIYQRDWDWYWDINGTKKPFPCNRLVTL